MRRIFLTSGLVLCLACPAFADIAAGTSSTSCTESVLGSTTGPVDFSSDWRPMISAAITLNSNKYSGTNGSPTQQYTASTTATPTPLYAVYGVGVYSSPQPTVGTLSNFTTNNRLTSLTRTPSLTGYVFDGFYTTPVSGGTQVISANGNFIYDAASTQFSNESTPTTWYARWTPNNYTVTYNPGLHGSGTAASYTGVSNGGLTYDSTWTTKTFAQTQLTAATGYSFSKWNTAQDGSGTDYTAGTAQSAWTTAGDLTLYAIYTANGHTITFASGDAHNSNNNNSGHQTPTHNSDNVSTTFTWNVSYGNGFAMPENDWNTPRGYTFGGWSSPYNLVSGQQTTTTYSNGENISAYNINQDITITALWDPINYTISYNTGRAGSRTSGFSGTMNSTSVDFDDAVTLRTNSYSIPGYTFNGWRGNYDNTSGLASIINSPYQTGGTVYTNSQSLSKYNIADNLILYAQWTPNNYTVTYNAGLHGSGSAVQYTGVSNGGLTYDSTWTTKTFAQTGLSAASGYSFSKWNTAQDGSGTDYTAGTAQSAWTTAGNLTLYAIYTANARPITYSCGGMTTCGTSPSNGSANYGQSYNLSSTYGSCAKEGHHATGWDCSGGATLTNATGSQNANTWSSDATISCTVHWVANTVNLNYYQDTNANSTFTTGTCNYGSTFNLPSSNLPTKPGYHINGWNIRGNGSASACAGQSMNCDTLENLDNGGFYDQEHYFAIGYASGADDCYSNEFSGGDPGACSDSRFSDLTTYGWKVENNGDGYWLYGTSKCSAHVGHHDDWWDSADSQYWSATTSQLTSAGNGNYCWCKAIGYNTDGESSLCNTESPAWIYIDQLNDTADCADRCADMCATAVRAEGGSIPDYAVFRNVLYGKPQ